MGLFNRTWVSAFACFGAVELISPCVHADIASNAPSDYSNVGYKDFPGLNPFMKTDWKGHNPKIIAVPSAARVSLAGSSNVFRCGPGWTYSKCNPTLKIQAPKERPQIAVNQNSLTEIGTRPLQVISLVTRPLTIQHIHSIAQLPEFKPVTSAIHTVRIPAHPRHKRHTNQEAQVKRDRQGSDAKAVPPQEAKAILIHHWHELSRIVSKWDKTPSPELKKQVWREFRKTNYWLTIVAEENQIMASTYAKRMIVMLDKSKPYSHSYTRILKSRLRKMIKTPGS